MKKIILNLIFLQIILITYGQNSYYSKGSSSFVGANVIDGGDNTNSKYCVVNINGEITKYTPNEVSEYGFKNGRQYIAKEIRIGDSLKRVFLERIIRDKTSLYYYKGRNVKLFFLQIDTCQLIELEKHKKPKSNLALNEQLLNITADCPKVSNAAKLVVYKKKSLKRFVSRYNNCELKPFPHFKYGLTFGYNSEKLIYRSDIDNIYLKDFNYTANRGLLIGLFADKPISASDFSVHFELYLLKNNYSFNKRTQSSDVDFIVNTTTLELPLLFRYTIPSNKIRPYFNAGATFSYNLRNENTLYVATIHNNTIELMPLSETTYIAKYRIGYNFGIGLESPINYKNSIFIDLRFGKSQGVIDTNTFGTSKLLLSAGINF